MIESCIIEDANVIVPKSEEKVVVNSFLTPDSLINVHLSRSVNLDEPNEFEYVENATLVIYENGQFLDSLKYRGQGRYYSSFYPKPLNEYQVQIETADGDILTASSTMPQKPNIVVEKIEPLSCQNSSFVYSGSTNIELVLKDSPSDYDYWFAFLETAYDGACYPSKAKTSYCPVSIMYSSDSRINKFNKSVFPSMTCKDILVTEFDLEAYVTKSAIEANNEPIGFIASSYKAGDYFISTVTASDEYSAYYKSVITNLRYEYGKDENPFNNPQATYTNISGGLGIFSCYNRTIIKIE